MRKINLIIYFGCVFGLIFIAASCATTGGAVTKNATGKERTDSKKFVVSYGKNGVPNFIRGDNLSASLERDPAFETLKENKQYPQMALYYLEHQRDLFKLTSARKEFVVEDVKTEATGQTHVKLKQVFNSIPVWGKELLVHLNSDDQIYYVNGYYQPISSVLVMKAAITDEAASKIALESKGNTGRWRVESVEQYIYAPSNEEQYLTFQVNLLKNTSQREYCFVDAVDGSVLHCVSRSTDAPRITIKN